MIRSHAVTSKEAIQEGGSAIALCGKPIFKTHWIAFTEALPNAQEIEVNLKWSDITCNKCRYCVFPGGYVYAAIESEEYETLKSKGIVSVAE